jgi:cadmium resistance protein CadD (predicted permease)
MGFQAEARKRRLAEKKEIEDIIAKRWEYGQWAVGFVVMALGIWLLVEYLLFLKAMGQ